MFSIILFSIVGGLSMGLFSRSAKNASTLPSRPLNNGFWATVAVAYALLIFVLIMFGIALRGL